MTHPANNSSTDVLEQLQDSQEILRRELDSTRSELEQTRRQLKAARKRLAVAETNMSKLARVDEVTGVANRRRFDEALSEEIKRMLRSQAELSMMLIEVDQWQDYVAREGLPRGVDSLRRVADTIANTFRRAGDLAGRYGSARFGVILPATGSETAARFAHRVLQNVHDACIPFADSNVTDRISISVGLVVLSPNRLHEATELVEIAEEQLAEAIRAGSNQVVKRLLQ